MSNDLQSPEAIADANSACERNSTDAAGSVATTEAVNEDRYKLQFEIDKSIRYHNRRKAHYELLHRLFMLGIILSGSAALAQVAKAPEILGGVAAFLGAFDLVFAWSHKARDHQTLASRFADLDLDVIRKEPITDENIRLWTAQRKRIEAEEPPVFNAVEADSWNETCRARGLNRDGQLLIIPCWHRATKNWIRHEGVEYFSEKDTRKRERMKRLRKKFGRRWKKQTPI
jgi:hypothetical protein